MWPKSQGQIENSVVKDISFINVTFRFLRIVKYENLNFKNQASDF